MERALNQRTNKPNHLKTLLLSYILGNHRKFLTGKIQWISAQSRLSHKVSKKGGSEKVALTMKRELKLEERQPGRDETSAERRVWLSAGHLQQVSPGGQVHQRGILHCSHCLL